MAEPSIEVPGSASVSERRLDSWKEIAAYLNRDVTTVQRWEKREGMPVYRHVHDKRGSVYAVPEELDTWRDNRRSRDEEMEREAAADEPRPDAAHRRWGARLNAWWFVGAAVVVLVVGGYTGWR